MSRRYFKSSMDRPLSSSGNANSPGIRYIKTLSSNGAAVHKNRSKLVFTQHLKTRD